MHHSSKSYAFILLLLALLPHSARSAERIDFVQDRLNNGLSVIYAPLRQAPVVHVRVLYHVGSRDERPDRQGFAHLFEHMMFRGSEHVKPEEHGKLISSVGGNSNAFTSFDQTVYVNTLPANQLELALYLEADRMASFKVSQQIYEIERNVVAEEWRRRQNSLYGSVWEDFAKLHFRQHPYRWTPIGNMDHLKSARPEELQAFFDTYYVPNNAVLILAGDFELPAAKALVGKYFGWIPASPALSRPIPPEPPQTQQRRLAQSKPVPLAHVMIGYHTPAYRSDDNYALALLGHILGAGNSSRLNRLLVDSANPLCVDANAHLQALQDSGIFMLSATVMKDKDADEVEKLLLAAAGEVADKGVSQEELEKAKTRERVAFVRNRETAVQVASQLGQEALFGSDANRVNTDLEKINAVSVEAVRAVARKYLNPANASVLRTNPGPVEKGTPGAPAALPPRPLADPAAAPAAPRAVSFPAGYPKSAPLADARVKASFAKGTETLINGVKVIVMPDGRLPSVNWHLTMRMGSHADPAGKEGLADLTASLVRRGSAGLSYQALNEDLESRGISISVNDGGDYTRLSGSCLTEQLDHALRRSREVLRQPALPAEEFAKLKEQTLSGLQYEQAEPETVATHELAGALFGASPLGRYATPASVSSITLEDIKACYGRLYRPNDAVLVIAGDVTVERGQALARQLLEGWEAAPLPAAGYALKELGNTLRIIVVDRPEGKQSLIRMAARAYGIQSDEKFAGSLASGILSSGIDARLGRYVRAEKGLVYSVWGNFRPARQGGQFLAGAETKLETTADCVEAMFKVFTDMGKDGVSEEEMAEAKLRAVGGMVMGMQTMQQQAGYRVEGILNGYPLDYWDRYPERIAAVAPGQVGEVVGRYLRPERITVVVVAPAQAVVKQLEKLGTVQVVAMPGKRGG